MGKTSLYSPDGIMALMQYIQDAQDIPKSNRGS